MCINVTLRVDAEGYLCQLVMLTTMACNTHTESLGFCANSPGQQKSLLAHIALFGQTQMCPLGLWQLDVIHLVIRVEVVWYNDALGSPWVDPGHKYCWLVLIPWLYCTWKWAGLTLGWVYIHDGFPGQSQALYTGPLLSPRTHNQRIDMLSEI